MRETKTLGRNERATCSSLRIPNQQHASPGGGGGYTKDNAKEVKNNELVTSNVTFVRRTNVQLKTSAPKETKKMVNGNESRFEIFRRTFIPSDVILYILDFYGGDFNSSATSERGSFNFKKFTRTWYGRFTVDSQVKFLFRYGVVDAKILSSYCHYELLLLLRHQFFTNNTMLENRLVQKLCECRADSIQSQRDVIKKLSKLKSMHSDLFDLIKNLDLVGVKTVGKVLEKLFELFRNVEQIKIGNYPLPSSTKSITNHVSESMVKPDEWGKALSKSNKKVKEVHCIEDIQLITDAFIRNTPLLETFYLEGTNSLKNLTNIHDWKNLKKVTSCYTNFLWNNVGREEQRPEFFTSLSSCENLTKLNLDNEIVKGEEFKELYNKLPTLKHLKLNNINLDEEMIKTICSFKNLTYFYCNTNGQDFIPFINSLSKLERLNISQVSDENISFICDLPLLRELVLVNSPNLTDTGASTLTNLTYLTKIYFQSFNCTHLVVERICKGCPLLERVGISLSPTESEKIPTTIRERYYRE